ncbi:Endonuclease domain-containing 1 protein [Liparis tanakae]|uniref:Endonuclease domain-containing 1 protein n=1 Tax=Liparis tanakae TaxID=230148 RepID=A0A4Z2EEI4_9TELE|nr:Endonuclease domain-containing 1 protein [Liparis tanakae]
MQTVGTLCALLSLLVAAHADVVERFEDVPECLGYFYEEKVPEYHFATLYDTIHRIAVYAAYHFQPSDGGGREKRWFVEPQVRGPNPPNTL